MGSKTDPEAPLNVGNVCSRRGVCAQGKAGSGTCECYVGSSGVPDFTGADCGDGECGLGKQLELKLVDNRWLLRAHVAHGVPFEPLRLLQCSACPAGEATTRRSRQARWTSRSTQGSTSQRARAEGSRRSVPSWYKMMH